MKTDILIIGGGFFGCALACHLAKQNTSTKILIVEKYNDLLQRASLVNQARVHSGFHYPRSQSTLLSCLENYKKFVRDYPDCVHSNFKNYYAIAKEGSKFSSDQFNATYKNANASFTKVPLNHNIYSLLNKQHIEDVFETEEYAFDAVKLKKLCKSNIIKLKNLKYKLNTKVESITNNIVKTNIGKIEAKQIYICAYSGTNDILKSSNLVPLDLNYVYAELCKLQVPLQYKNLAITLMDGPFFSLYPYPVENCHTLSHVVHTIRRAANDIPESFKPTKSNIFTMLQDVSKYLPGIKDTIYKGSLYETKVLLPKNIIDSGRPILYKKQMDNEYVYNVIGGKLDNVYDLFEVLENRSGMNVSLQESL